MNTKSVCIALTSVLLALAIEAKVPALADETALQQLIDINHSSQDAASAADEGNLEAAKDLSSQGLDTANTDPEPSDNTSGDNPGEE